MICERLYKQGEIFFLRAVKASTQLRGCEYCVVADPCCGPVHRLRGCVNPSGCGRRPAIHTTYTSRKPRTKFTPILPDSAQLSILCSTRIPGSVCMSVCRRHLTNPLFSSPLSWHMTLFWGQQFFPLSVSEWSDAQIGVIGVSWAPFERRWQSWVV